MTAPDFIAPEVGLPLAALLWGLALLPHAARYLRARRATRR